MGFKRDKPPDAPPPYSEVASDAAPALPPRHSNSQGQPPRRGSYSSYDNHSSASQSRYGSHSAHSSSQDIAQGHWGSAQRPPPPQPNPYLNYPSGYRCPKCNNTGYKPSGRSCKDCWERFGRANNLQWGGYQHPGYYPGGWQMPNPFYGPSGYAGGPPPGARVVNPGDPAIGGVLCGRCRGSGLITDLLLFESTCPVCGGIGRVL